MTNILNSVCYIGLYVHQGLYLSDQSVLYTAVCDFMAKAFLSKNGVGRHYVEKFFRRKHISFLHG